MATAICLNWSYVHLKYLGQGNLPWLTTDWVLGCGGGGRRIETWT